MNTQRVNKLEISNSIDDQKKHMQSENQMAMFRYMQDVNSYRLLSAEETEELVLKYQNEGDLQAGKDLVTANLRLVVKIAGDFQKYWTNNFPDLVQEGNIGLIKAINKFEPDRGIKFSYYATFWIRAYILKFIMDNWRLVKLGTTQAQRKLFYKLNKEKKVLEAKALKPRAVFWPVGSMSGKETLLKWSSVSTARTSPLRALFHLTPIWSTKIFWSRMDRRSKSLPPKEKSSKRSRDFWISRRTLEDRLLQDDSRSLKNIAEQFDISRERIRQIEARLLKKIGKNLQQEMPDLGLGLPAA